MILELGLGKIKIEQKSIKNQSKYIFGKARIVMRLLCNGVKIDVLFKIPH